MPEGRDLYERKEGLLNDNKIEQVSYEKIGSQIFVWISACFMVLGFFLGYAFPSGFRAVLTPSLRHVVEIVDQTKAAHSWAFTFLQIFLNNAWVAVMFVGLGFLFGIYPVIALWMNGLLIGFVANLSSNQLHVPVWKMLLYGIAPHGIFELSAFIWAGGVGIANGFAVLMAIRSLISRESALKPVRRSQGPLAVAVRRSLRSLPYIIGLLLVAALVESSLTPMLIRWGIHHA